MDVRAQVKLKPISSISKKRPATDPCPLIEAELSDIFACFRKRLEDEADTGEYPEFTRFER